MSIVDEKSIIKIGRKSVLLTLLVVTIVIVSYALMTRSYTNLFRINLITLAIAVCIELLSWFISAIRLRIIHRIMDGVDKTLSLKHYFYSRLLGGFLAYLTPSAIGGEPARAYYLYLLLKNNYSRYLALAFYEVFYDIVVVNTLAIIFSINKIPYTIPVIVVSSSTLITWFLMFNVFRNIALKKHTCFSRISKFIENRLINKIRSLTSAYLDFGRSFREVVDNTRFRDIVIILSLTIAMYLTSSLTITIVAVSIDTESSLIKQYVDSLHAFLYSLSLGALPTPGGSIAVEYGLSIVLKPEVVVTARTLSYYLVIIAGALVLFKIGLHKHIAK